MRADRIALGVALAVAAGGGLAWILNRRGELTLERRTRDRLLPPARLRPPAGGTDLQAE